MEKDHPTDEPLESREPALADLVELCRQLNQRGAKYLVIGGFAMRAAGFDRRTMDIDLLIETSVDNETRVFSALETLPDGCVRELTPGEVAKYAVVRVADEIVVDLMKAACGIEYAAAIDDAITHEVDGVSIPFASPRLLWRTKRSTHRAKDAADLHFLAMLFDQAGEAPPED